MDKTCDVRKVSACRRAGHKDRTCCCRIRYSVLTPGSLAWLDQEVARAPVWQLTLDEAQNRGPTWRRELRKCRDKGTTRSGERGSRGGGRPKTAIFRKQISKTSVRPQNTNSSVTMLFESNRFVSSCRHDNILLTCSRAISRSTDTNPLAVEFSHIWTLQPAYAGVCAPHQYDFS